jgi:hypothetical protein
MKSKILRRLTVVLVLALMLVIPVLAHAQSGGGYDLSWSTIDDGGGTSVGGGYALNGTIGQPDVGITLAGGGYSLVGGFWGGALTPYRVHLPVVIKGS